MRFPDQQHQSTKEYPSTKHDQSNQKLFASQMNLQRKENWTKGETAFSRNVPFSSGSAD